MRLLSPVIVKSPRTRGALLILVVAEGAWAFGCSSGAVSSQQPPPPPTLSVTVSVSPANTSVVLGGQAVFTATVANTADITVNWSVNGVPGGSATLGTIPSVGIYTAPTDMPSSASVQVAATS